MTRAFFSLTVRLCGILALLCCIMILSMMLVGRMLPTGGRLAFMAQVDVYNWDIFVMDMRYRLSYPVGNTSSNERYPAWSPDGQWLAFHSDRNMQQNGRWDIFITRLDGRESYQLTGDNMTAYADYDPEQLCREIIDAQGTLSIACIGVEGNAMAAWSPDGQRIAFHSDLKGNWDIYSIAIDGSDIQPLSTLADDAVLPSWSPDGAQIAYTSGTTGFNFITLMDADGKNRRRLTTLEGVQLPENKLITTPSQTVEDAHPMWSPDGSQLVFTSNREGIDNLYLLDVATATITPLTSGYYRNYNPIWLDAETIAFTSTRNSMTRLYSIKTDGSDIQPLFTFPYETDAAAWYMPR